MQNLAQDIHGCKKLIYDSLNDSDEILNVNIYEGIQKVYYHTNENVEGYLSRVDFTNYESALCAAGSGDQAFSLVTKGIHDIHLFDVNKLTPYFILGLRRAMILKCSYEEFLQVNHDLIYRSMDLDEISDTLKSFFSFMDKEMRAFWQEIIDYNYNLQKNYEFSCNLIAIICRIAMFPRGNDAISYLKSKQDYDILRENISKVNFKFTEINAKDLPKIKGNYDVLLLSNILDYMYIYWGYNWDIDRLNKYIQKISKMINDLGTIFLHYAFLPNNYSLIEHANIRLSDIKDLEFILLPKCINEVVNDGIILKRVKK